MISAESTKMLERYQKKHPSPKMQTKTLSLSEVPQIPQTRAQVTNFGDSSLLVQKTNHLQKPNAGIVVHYKIK